MDYTTEQDNRYQELYESAVARYLDKSDFNPSDWLDEEEAKELEKLQDKIFA